MIDQQNSYHTALDAAYEGLLTMKESAEYVGMQYDAFLWNVGHGKLERKQYDGKWRCSIEALDAFKAKRAAPISTVDTPPIEEVPAVPAPVSVLPEMPIVVQPTLAPIAPIDSSANRESDLIARVISVAFEQVQNMPSVRLASLREATPAARFWYVEVLVGEKKCMYHVWYDGQEVSIKMPVE